ncbi:protein of unknown function [Vibrio tapetis subsp. tapetis]|uniref:Uncharacterized protein n=1 Tax=Vibrio tapetis subsp. tapetis TaxID=1671868 RepID=A0A2N8Z893_9VIBR|nr:protein of unknown function [Vibrio tapetis subsp. tapetis]
MRLFRKKKCKMLCKISIGHGTHKNSWCRGRFAVRIGEESGVTGPANLLYKGSKKSEMRTKSSYYSR